MFEIINMKADFEPWWMFEGWEKDIVSRQSFEDYSEAIAYLEMTLTKMRESHRNEAMKKGCFFAFWSKDEKVFCEACDEDLQIYHGVIFMKEGKPAISENV